MSVYDETTRGRRGSSARLASHGAAAVAVGGDDVGSHSVGGLTLCIGVGPMGHDGPPGPQGVLLTCQLEFSARSRSEFGSIK